MPIFEYQCKKCGHCFEALMRSAEEAPPECPACKDLNVEKLMSAGCVRPMGIPSGSGGFKPPACSSSGGG